jgi:hypothetical protein
MVQPVVARGDQSLLLVLMEQTDRRLGVLLHVLLYNRHGVVGGSVVYHDDLVRHDRLPECVVEAIGDAVLLIPRGDDNRYIQHML